MVKSVEGIIGKQIGFDKLGELEVMPSFKGEMRKYPANYEIIRGTIQEQGDGKEQSQNIGPTDDPKGPKKTGTALINTAQTDEIHVEATSVCSVFIISKP